MSADAVVSALAVLPEPPYYAVIFASRRSGVDEAAYAAMAEHMVQLAATQSGFLGIDSARDADGVGITVSYWRSTEDILAWRNNAEHAQARALGRSRWYSEFSLRVAKVERAYSRVAETSASV